MTNRWPQVRSRTTAKSWEMKSMVKPSRRRRSRSRSSTSACTEVSSAEVISSAMINSGAMASALARACAGAGRRRIQLGSGKVMLRCEVALPLTGWATTATLWLEVPRRRCPSAIVPAKIEATQQVTAAVLGWADAHRPPRSPGPDRRRHRGHR